MGMIPGKARENVFGRMPATKNDESGAKSADSSKVALVFK